ncbi:MAG: hypothetical protein IKF11_03380 [Methanobrevibacter sp.]|nr:hypothetical protein [Methanobrevibacter sp.]
MEISNHSPKSKSTRFPRYLLNIRTIGPMIIAEITVPSRTPARYPKNANDNIAAVSTKDTSQ